ncbi:hypothetical protein DFH09DRAFT_1087590 [Mycena vulgaris]|nr:hypothetical protein DFH09DRAFT_1087590 [Mycena vulgaris]
MPLRTFYYTGYSYWHVLWMKIGFNLTELNIIGHSGGMAGFLHDLSQTLQTQEARTSIRSLIFYQAEGNAGYWWISDPDFDEAVRLRVLRIVNNEMAWLGTVAGAINDGGEVDPGVVETAIKKWDARMGKYSAAEHKPRHAASHARPPKPSQFKLR